MNIQNGIIQDNNVVGVPLVSMIVSDIKGTGHEARTGIKLIGGTPDYIAVHDTGNTAVTADAVNHAKYVNNCEISAAVNDDIGYHFCVDDKQIVQILPLDEKAWHASDDASGKGNGDGIGIEMCECFGMDRAKVEQNAKKLIKALMEQFKIPLENVQPHRYFATATKKLCPHNILKSEATWQSDWNKWSADLAENKAKTEDENYYYNLNLKGFDTLEDLNAYAKTLKLPVGITKTYTKVVEV